MHGEFEQLGPISLARALVYVSLAVRLTEYEHKSLFNRFGAALWSVSKTLQNFIKIVYSDWIDDIKFCNVVTEDSFFERCGKGRHKKQSA